METFNWQQIVSWSQTNGVAVLTALILVIVTLTIISMVTKKLSSSISKRIKGIEEKKRVNTLFRVTRTALRATTIVIGGMIILSSLGVDLAPILATVGIFGLAISFGAQALVKDIISGIFILLENHIRVGDVVEISGHTGTVEDIKIRTIVIRDLGGDVHIIPNGKVEDFVNKSMGFSKSVVDIGVGYKEDVDHVMKVIKEVGEELVEDPEFKEMFNDKVLVMGVQDLGEYSVVIRTLLSTQPALQWAAAREFRRRIKNRFDKDGIEIPFPTRKLFQIKVDDEDGPDKP